MSPIHRNPELTVLRTAAALAVLALAASAVVAMLMEAGVLRASPTRFAALGIVALAFVNWLVRLLIELGKHHGLPGGAAGGGARQSHGASVYDWFRQRQRRQRRAF